MATFLALTSRGLPDVLATELEELGFKGLKKSASGVEFQSNWLGCYRANLCLRSATRVVLPILDFQAYTPEELYAQVFKGHDFTKYIDPKQTLSVEASARDSKIFRHDHFVGQKVKDAIVDQFRKKFDQRPDVDSENPDLRVLVRVVRNSVSLAIDTSGAPLSHRGYRVKTVAAPLREHLAAGLLLATGYRGEMPVVDLMCGSGTFLTEALWIAQNFPPGGLRKTFGFERLKNFNREGWLELREKEMAKVNPLSGVWAYGFDKSREAISAAQVNMKAARVLPHVQLKVEDIRRVQRPADEGLLVINPPYGERLGKDQKDLEDLYAAISETWKREFTGWDCWLLSGNEELTRFLKLKSERRVPVFNGNLECRFLKYHMR